MGQSLTSNAGAKPGRAGRKSAAGAGLRKRSFAIKGHRTSIALELPFWDALESLARADGRSLPDLIGEIDAARMKSTPPPSLASALRVYALRRSRSDLGGGLQL